MDLTRNLRDVPITERGRFLRKKLRELKLVQAADRITDRHVSLSDLADHTLSLMQRFFHCHLASMMLVDPGIRQPLAFFCKGLPDQSRDGDTGETLRDLMRSIPDHSEVKLVATLPVGFPSQDSTRFAAISFHLEGELRGILLAGDRARDFDEEDLHFLGAVASQIDNAILHGRFLEKFRKTRTHARKTTKQLDFMYEVSLSIGRDEDFVSLTRRILESSLQLVEVNRCSLMLYDEARDELKTELVVGAPLLKSGFRLKLGQGVAGQALKTGKAILAERGAGDVRFVSLGNAPEPAKGVVNLACVPLICDGRPLGVLNFSSTDPEYSISRSELETLEVVAHLILLAWQRQKLVQLSVKDELTGLFTFRFFRQRLGEEVRNSCRDGRPFCLVLFDLDHFKGINDTHGHLMGNTVLQTVAGVIKNVCRTPEDLAARFGGEEFALLLPGTTPQEAGEVAERVRCITQALNISREGLSLKVTISGGVASLPGVDSPEKLIEQADQALYKAKTEGRNRIVVG